MIDAKKKVAIAMVMLAALGAGIRPAAAQMEAGKLARDTAKDYREAARYPASSHALKKGEADPIQEKRIPTRQTRRGPDDAEPAISVWERCSAGIGACLRSANLKSCICATAPRL